MLTDYRFALFCSASLLFVLTSAMSLPKVDMPEENDEGNALPFTDDELSYALSELSVDDLHAVSLLMDAIGEQSDIGSESNVNSQMSSEEFARYKRENSDSQAEGDQENSMPNVDEEYLKQLDDSFPNVGVQSNQDDKQPEHIRVKRK